MSLSRCCGTSATRSLRITVCTNAPAPAASVVETVRTGTVSPASTTEASAYSIRKRDGGLDRPMVGRRDPDPDAVGVPHRSVGVLVHLDDGRFGDVGVMGDPVADVGSQRRQRRLDDGGRARRADDAAAGCG